MAQPVDREKMTPTLVRMFYQTGAHHKPTDFDIEKFPSNEIQIYTWPDATLRELTDLVKEVNEEARAPTSRLDFCLVYPTRAGHFVFRPLGSVRSTKPGRDDDATLSRLRFQPGDYIDIAIFPY